MTQALYILMALGVGITSAFQVSMLAGLGRFFRGSLEATLVSMLASVIGALTALNIQILRGEPPNLPSPFNNQLFMGSLLIAAIAGLLVSMRGVTWYYALTGLAGFFYVVAASYLGQKIGVALFVASVTAGTLIGSVVLDHYGAFGNEVRQVTIVRAVGVVALVLGVVLVRFDR